MISLMNYIVQNATNLDDPLQLIPQFRKFLVDLKLLKGKESMSEEFWRWVKSGPTVAAQGVQVKLPNMNSSQSGPVALNPKFQHQITLLKTRVSEKSIFGGISIRFKISIW